MKPPCVVAAIANIVLAGLQTVNGVAVAQGDRVLVTAQTSAIDNGIYLADSGSWNRAADFDGDRDVINGTLVVVPASAGVGLFYQTLATNPVIPGSSAVHFIPLNNPSITYPTLFFETGVTNTSYNYGDIRRHGAISGTGDCTTAVLNALASYYQAKAPQGDWRLDGQVQIGLSQTLQLDAGAVFTRYSAFSAATTPMFWLSYAKSGLIGAGAASQIVTQNKAPDGIVLVGASSMTASMGRDITYGRISDLALIGKTAYGQTSGAPDACLKIINPQLDGKVTYFFNIDNILFQSANYGLWLQGWANGNQITRLHAQFVGNVTRGAPGTANADAMVFSQGALDNVINGLFHHFSPSTTTVLIQDYDNTGTPGGSLHVTSYSAFMGIACEQSQDTTTPPSAPWAAYALVANASCTAFKNFIQIIDNVTSGYSVSNAFRDANTVLYTSTGASLEFAQVRKTLSVAGLSTLAGVIKAQTQDTVTTLAYSAAIAINAALGDNFTVNATNNTAFTINNPTNSAAGQRITVTVRNTSGGALGVLTWDTNYRNAAWTQPANGTSRSIDFEYVGTVWVERSRTTVDVPN